MLQHGDPLLRRGALLIISTLAENCDDCMRNDLASLVAAICICIKVFSVEATICVCMCV